MSRTATGGATQAPWRCRNCGTDIYKQGIWRHRHDGRAACPSWQVAEPAVTGGSDPNPTEATRSNAHPVQP